MNRIQMEHQHAVQAGGHRIHADKRRNGQRVSGDNPENAGSIRFTTILLTDSTIEERIAAFHLLGLIVEIRGSRNNGPVGGSLGGIGGHFPTIAFHRGIRYK